jgi:hypothetical protein
VTSFIAESSLLDDSLRTTLIFELAGAAPRRFQSRFVSRRISAAKEDAKGSAAARRRTSKVEGKHDAQYALKHVKKKKRATAGKTPTQRVDAHFPPRIIGWGCVRAGAPADARAPRPAAWGG